MMYVYKQLGITLDHYAAWQYLEGTRIAPQNLQPGDLVFWEPKADGPGHVGMYVGDGKMINAPHTGDVVRIVSVQGPAVHGRRPAVLKPDRRPDERAELPVAELKTMGTGPATISLLTPRVEPGLKRLGVERPAQAARRHPDRRAPRARSVSTAPGSPTSETSIAGVHRYGACVRRCGLRSCRGANRSAASSTSSARW